MLAQRFVLPYIPGLLQFRSLWAAIRPAIMRKVCPVAHPLRTLTANRVGVLGPQ